MEYEINDARVDGEHRLILQLLESFASLPSDSERETVLELLTRIKQHVVVHFVDEEYIFEKELRMPQDYVAFHKSEHEKLRDRVLSAINACKSNSQPDMHSLVASIRDEVVNHIETVDSQMVAYANGSSRT